MAEVKATTNEGTKFTEKEMERIGEFKASYDAVTVSYGQLQMEKLALSEQENKIIDKYNELRKEEKTFVKELSDKYGVGELNIETGVFIPQR